MIIDRFVKFLLPKDERFFVYLSSVAKGVAEGARIFSEFGQANTPQDFQRVSATLRQKEHEVDELAHLLYEELDKTFITPIDREDLHALTSALDDVLDDMEHSAAQIVVYKLEALTPPMRELVRLAENAAMEVSKCVDDLRDMSKISEIQVHVIHVNSIENEGDLIYRKALENLFSTKGLDPIELIRQKEILRGLEDTIDACEDVMDLIRSVVVKNG